MLEVRIAHAVEHAVAWIERPISRLSLAASEWVFEAEKRAQQRDGAICGDTLSHGLLGPIDPPHVCVLHPGHSTPWHRSEEAVQWHELDGDGRRG